MIVNDTKYTYEDLHARVCKASNALLSLGLDYDSRVLLFASDSIESVCVWLGAIRAGIGPVWVSPLCKADELTYFIRDTACKALFIDESQRIKLSAKNDLPETLRSIIVNGGNTGEYLSYDELVGSQKPEFRSIQKHKDDICYFFYSGGTTGRAKCIVHATSDFVLVPDRHTKFLGWTENDVHYDTSPKVHTHGLWPGVLIPLHNGATCVLSGKKTSIDEVVHQLERHVPTVLTTVPTVLKWLVTLPDDKKKIPDARCLRMVTSAAEKVPAVIHEKFRRIYGLEILDSIGSSEVTYEWLANRPLEHRTGSCGKPIFGVEVKLMNPNTMEQVTQPNKEGEIWLKSDTSLMFYWRKQDKTIKTKIGEWVRTGDSLYFDEDGFFHHVGRIDDLFKIHGLWISPLEIEEVLLKHEAIKDAAIIPKIDADGLTYPKAFLVLKDGFSLTDDLKEELREAITREVGGYKVPREIAAIDELPKTVYQKVNRLTLRSIED